MEHKTFAELGLSAKVLAAVTAAGYATPTPIQAQAIPVALTGRDVLGIAYAASVGAADAPLAGEARFELAELHADGYFDSAKNAARLKGDADLAPLRQRDDFRKLLAQVEKAP